MEWLPTYADNKPLELELPSGYRIALNKRASWTSYLAAGNVPLHLVEMFGSLLDHPEKQGDDQAATALQFMDLQICAYVANPHIYMTEELAKKHKGAWVGHLTEADKGAIRNKITELEQEVAAVLGNFPVVGDSALVGSDVSALRWPSVVVSARVGTGRSVPRFCH